MTVTKKTANAVANLKTSTSSVLPLLNRYSPTQIATPASKPSKSPKKHPNILNTLMTQHKLSHRMAVLFQAELKETIKAINDLRSTHQALLATLVVLNNKQRSHYVFILKLFAEIEKINYETYKTQGVFIQPNMIPLMHITGRVEMLDRIESKILKIKSSTVDKEIAKRDINVLRNLHSRQQAILDAQGLIEHKELIPKATFDKIKDTEVAFIDAHAFLLEVRSGLDKKIKAHYEIMAARKKAHLQTSGNNSVAQKRSLQP